MREDWADYGNGRKPVVIASFPGLSTKFNINTIIDLKIDPARPVIFVDPKYFWDEPLLRPVKKKAVAEYEAVKSRIRGGSFEMSNNPQRTAVSGAIGAGGDLAPLGDFSMLDDRKQPLSWRDQGSTPSGLRYWQGFTRDNSKDPVDKFTDVWPQLDSDNMITLGEDRAVYVDVNFKDRFLPSQICVVAWCGDPANAKSWREVYAEHVEDKFMAHRYKVNIPLGAKMFTFKVSTDHGETWRWSGFDINVANPQEVVRFFDMTPEIGPDNIQKLAKDRKARVKVELTQPIEPAKVRMVVSKSNNYLETPGYKDDSHYSKGNNITVSRAKNYGIDPGKVKVVEFEMVIPEGVLEYSFRVETTDGILMREFGREIDVETDGIDVVRRFKTNLPSGDTVKSVLTYFVEGDRYPILEIDRNSPRYQGDVPWEERDFRNNPRRLCWQAICKIDGAWRVVGYIAYEHRIGSKIEILRFKVAQNYQGCGIEQEMIRKVKEKIAGLGTKRVECVVHEDDSYTNDILRSEGFKVAAGGVLSGHFDGNKNGYKMAYSDKASTVDIAPTDKVYNIRPISKDQIMPSYYIRPMIRRDMPEVLDIEQHFNRNKGDNPWNENEFIRVQHQRNCIGMAVEYKEQVVGFIVYDYGEGRINLLRLGVHPDFCDKGVAEALINKLKSKLKLSVHRWRFVTTQVCERDPGMAVFLTSPEIAFKKVSTLKGRYGMDEDAADSYVFRYAIPSPVELDATIIPLMDERMPLGAITKSTGASQVKNTLFEMFLAISANPDNEAIAKLVAGYARSSSADPRTVAGAFFEYLTDLHRITLDDIILYAGEKGRTNYDARRQFKNRKMPLTYFENLLEIMSQSEFLSAFSGRTHHIQSIIASLIADCGDEVMREFILLNEDAIYRRFNSQNSDMQNEIVNIGDLVEEGALRRWFRFVGSSSEALVKYGRYAYEYIAIPVAENHEHHEVSDFAGLIDRLCSTENSDTRLLFMHSIRSRMLKIREEKSRYASLAKLAGGAMLCGQLLAFLEQSILQSDDPYRSRMAFDIYSSCEENRERHLAPEQLKKRCKDKALEFIKKAVRGVKEPVARSWIAYNLCNYITSDLSLFLERVFGILKYRKDIKQDDLIKEIYPDGYYGLTPFQHEVLDLILSDTSKKKQTAPHASRQPFDGQPPQRTAVPGAIGAGGDLAPLGDFSMLDDRPMPSSAWNPRPAASGLRFWQGPGASDVPFPSNSANADRYPGFTSAETKIIDERIDMLDRELEALQITAVDMVSNAIKTLSRYQGMMSREVIAKSFEKTRRPILSKLRRMRRVMTERRFLTGDIRQCYIDRLDPSVDLELSSCFTDILIHAVSKAKIRGVTACECSHEYEVSGEKVIYRYPALDFKGHRIVINIYFKKEANMITGRFIFYNPDSGSVMIRSALNKYYLFTPHSDKGRQLTEFREEFERLRIARMSAIVTKAARYKDDTVGLLYDDLDLLYTANTALGTNKILARVVENLSAIEDAPIRRISSICKKDFYAKLAALIYVRGWLDLSDDVVGKLLKRYDGRTALRGIEIFIEKCINAPLPPKEYVEFAKSHAGKDAKVLENYANAYKLVKEALNISGITVCKLSRRVRIDCSTLMNVVNGIGGLSQNALAIISEYVHTQAAASFTNLQKVLNLDDAEYGKVVSPKNPISTVEVQNMKHGDMAIPVAVMVAARAAFEKSKHKIMFDLIEQSNLTLKNFAEATGVKYSFVKRIKAKTTNFSPEYVIKAREAVERLSRASRAVAKLKFNIHIRSAETLTGQMIGSLNDLPEWVRISFAVVRHGGSLSERRPYTVGELFKKAHELIAGSEIAIFVESDKLSQDVLDRMARHIAAVAEAYEESGRRGILPGSLERIGNLYRAYLNDLTAMGFDIEENRAKPRTDDAGVFVENSKTSPTPETAPTGDAVGAGQAVRMEEEVILPKAPSGYVTSPTQSADIIASGALQSDISLNTPLQSPELTTEIFNKAKKIVDRKLRRLYKNKSGVDYESYASSGIAAAADEFAPDKGSSFLRWLCDIGYLRAIDVVRSSIGRKGSAKNERQIAQFYRTEDDHGRAIGYAELIPDAHSKQVSAEDDRAAIFNDEIKPFLSPAAELIMRLHYIEDKPVGEIARALGKSAGAVYLMIRNTKECLKERRYVNIDLRLNGSIISRGFGRRITRIIESVGISQDDLRRILGLSESTMSTWKSGQHPPTYNNMAALAIKTGIPLEYILKGEKSDIAVARIKEMIGSHVADHSEAIQRARRLSQPGSVSLECAAPAGSSAKPGLPSQGGTANDLTPDSLLTDLRDNPERMDAVPAARAPAEDTPPSLGAMVNIPYWIIESLSAGPKSRETLVAEFTGRITAKQVMGELDKLIVSGEVIERDRLLTLVAPAVAAPDAASGQFYSEKKDTISVLPYTEATLQDLDFILIEEAQSMLPELLRVPAFFEYLRSIAVNYPALRNCVISAFCTSDEITALNTIARQITSELSVRTAKDTIVIPYEAMSGMKAAQAESIDDIKGRWPGAKFMTPQEDRKPLGKAAKGVPLKFSIVPNEMRVYSPETLHGLVEIARKEGAVYATAISGAGKTWGVNKILSAEAVRCDFTIIKGSSTADIMYRLGKTIGLEQANWEEEAFCTAFKNRLANKVLVIEEFGGAMRSEECRKFLNKLINVYKIPVIFSQVAMPEAEGPVKSLVRDTAGYAVKHIRLSLASIEAFDSVMRDIIGENVEAATKYADDDVKDGEIDFANKAARLIPFIYELTGGHLSTGKEIVDGIIRASNVSQKDEKTKAYEMRRAVEETIISAQGLTEFLKRDGSLFGSNIAVIMDHYTGQRDLEYENSQRPSDNYKFSSRLAVLLKFRDGLDMMEVAGWSDEELLLVREMVDYGLLQISGDRISVIPFVSEWYLRWYQMMQDRNSKLSTTPALHKSRKPGEPHYYMEPAPDGQDPSPLPGLDGVAPVRGSEPRPAQQPSSVTTNAPPALIRNPERADQDAEISDIGETASELLMDIRDNPTRLDAALSEKGIAPASDTERAMFETLVGTGVFEPAATAGNYRFTEMMGRKAGQYAIGTIANSKGEIFDDIWKKMHEEQLVINAKVQDPRNWEIEEGEAPFARKFSRMSLDELEHACKGLKKGLGLIYDYGELARFRSDVRFPYLTFLTDILSNSKHEFVHRFKSTLAAIIMVSDVLENVESTKKLLSAKVFEYKKKAFLREFAKRWSQGTASDTQNLINVVTGAPADVNKPAAGTILGRKDIPAAELPMVRKALKMHVSDYVFRQIKESQVTEKVYTIKAWAGYAAPSQTNFLTKIRKITQDKQYRVSFDEIGELVSFACNNVNNDTVTILPLNMLDADQVTALKNANAKVIYINLDGRNIGADDLVDLEGLIGTGKAYLADDEESFYKLYRLLVKNPVSDYVALNELKSNPLLFINRLKFILRPIDVKDPAELSRLKARQEYLLEFA